MSKKSNGGGDKPSFIRQLAKSGSSTQVACRVPSHVKERYDKAQKLLRQHGEDMQIADVVRAALEDAAEFVERRYGSGTTGTISTSSNATVR